MEEANKIDIIYYSIAYYSVAYILSLIAVFIVKVLVMHAINYKYDNWRQGIKESSIFNILPLYFCEWCSFFWISFFFILIFCLIFGNWYLMLTPVLSTPLALSKYK